MSAAAAVSYEYDWVWRKQPGPMTFRFLLREGIEICSPELFLRRLGARATVGHARMCGLLIGLEMQRDLRLIDQWFVRAYLFERRAGAPMRAPGPPPGCAECEAEAYASVDRMVERERAEDQRLEQAARDLRDVQRWKMFAAIWAAIGCLMEGE